ncbi:MAG: DEAD/DEAH box helicase family protein, partial [Chloroflexota bacterium]|nr:DEAD/DEAH box helicase family protein [Chloroflexota bacterium]
MDRFDPRTHQWEQAQATESKIVSGDRLLVANIFPGMGKTKGYLNALNILFRAGEIDHAVILTPRINLAQQVENDWNRMVRDGLFAVPHMGTIHHRLNAAPILNPGEFGYVTTYQSLMQSPQLHLDFLKGKRFALVCDEAQQLGADIPRADVEMLGAGTKSAEVVKALMEMARLTSLMSGTPDRADGRGLLGLDAIYEEPDERGFRKLIADVTATYENGIEHGYLRPFDFVYHDGTATKKYITEQREEVLTLSEQRGGLSAFLEGEAIWQPMVDMTVERVRDVQKIDRRFAGLIGATNQRHAGQIVEYLKRRHPTVKVLLARSQDGKEAHQNLTAFKRGKHDLLVTVAMAH